MISRSGGRPVAKKKEPEAKDIPPQIVVRVNPEQRECLLELASLEDRTLSDTIKEGCKLLAAKHGKTWPKTRA